jgi:hypothetical protein
MKKQKHIVWQGCYDAGWKGLIADEAFAHPAKFSRNLIGRIYRHMIDRGWLAAGMTVVDPFGGVALGALDAMANGLHWCGCELEPKFHKLGNANIAEWVRRYGHTAGWGSARLLNGDSRRLCDFVGGADCVVSSPPYSERHAYSDEARNEARAEKLKASGAGIGGTRGLHKPSGEHPDNLAQLRPGSVDAVLSSPPYADHAKVPGGDSDARSGVNNLGNLRPGSVDSVVSSPPYAETFTNKDNKPSGCKVEPEKMGRSLKQMNANGYGITPGNLGSDTGETFWHAAREIVQQCHAILKPGGIAAWVTKDFVRAKKRVPFSADWLNLCEACGFELVEWVHASLVKDLGKHSDLYGDVHHKTVERKSFFRRLAEKKGSPRIDHEDVIFVRKS